MNFDILSGEDQVIVVKNKVLRQKDFRGKKRVMGKTLCLG